MPEVEDARRGDEASVLAYVSRFSGGATLPSIHVRFGAIAEEIAEAARDCSATMIVVGAAPHQRVNHIVAGERAVHVLRASRVPVLSVPPGFEALPRNILVAIDFAPASIRAAQAALLLLGNGGTLTLLHVLSPLLGDRCAIEDTNPVDTIQTLFARARAERSRSAR
jgi:nucleotide-binding universal stress UspA family protein